MSPHLQTETSDLTACRKVETSQYCQAHTILKKFAGQYFDTPVLVLGGHLDTVRQVANRYVIVTLAPRYLKLILHILSYGYQKAYTTLDVLAWNPA